MHVLIRAHFVCFVTLCTRNLHLTQFTVYFLYFGTKDDTHVSVLESETAVL